MAVLSGCCGAVDDTLHGVSLTKACWSSLHVAEIGATRVLGYSIGRFIVASILPLFTIFATVLDAHEIEDARLLIIVVLICCFGRDLGAVIPLD